MNEIRIKLLADILWHETVIKNRAEKILPNLKIVLNLSTLKDIWIEDMNKFSFQLAEGYPVDGTIKCNRRDITLTAIITTVNRYETIKFLLFKKRRFKKKDYDCNEKSNK